MSHNRPTSPPHRWTNLIFSLIVLVYAIYGVIFIVETIFVVDGKPYSALFDDAMISMTYARNFAEGHGLVWNVGDRVEGYTNPLWVVFMAGFHLLPIPENWISLAIQVAGGDFLCRQPVFRQENRGGGQPGAGWGGAAGRIADRFLLSPDQLVAAGQ